MPAGPHSAPIRIERRIYTRPFSRPMPLGQSKSPHRNGLLLRLQQGSSIGYGECNPLPDFGSERFEDACQWFSQLPHQANHEALARLLITAPPASAFALESALMALESCATAGDQVPPPMETAALCGLDVATPPTVVRMVAQGFRRIKLKVGRNSAVSEINLFKQLVETVPGHIRFRLDPNRLWSPADWRLWCAALESLHAQVEFIEEPIEPTHSEISFWAELAKQCAVPLALDEWLGQNKDGLESALAADWPGWLILKPGVLGCTQRWLPAVAAGDQANRLVISSAFESAIGSSRLLRIAAMFPGIAHGLGTQRAFEDDFGCHVASSSIHAPDRAQLDFVWDNLGTAF